MPAKAGIHLFWGVFAARRWIPAFAGMTPRFLATGHRAIHRSRTSILIETVF
jgi:hypothetical protein